MASGQSCSDVGESVVIDAFCIGREAGISSTGCGCGTPHVNTHLTSPDGEGLNAFSGWNDTKVRQILASRAEIVGLLGQLDSQQKYSGHCLRLQEAIVLKKSLIKGLLTLQWLLAVIEYLHEMSLFKVENCVAYILARTL